ncbi:hypothetical protein LTS12_018978 [Elasticomyces elasticus]|nr:hypothetical protein LTS12_018978 [Elasticomyces elasticus]
MRLDTEDAFKSMRRKHSRCKLKRNLTLPTRLLDISGTQEADLRLVETQGLRARYAILSYCWGGKQAVVTNRCDIERYKNKLALKSLPPTLQDAVKVARSIGFEYLWVDALCICQDDIEEQALEIARMHDYYKDASITILAANAQQTQDGFLVPALKESWVEIMVATAEQTVSKLRLSHYTIDFDSEDAGSDAIENIPAKLRTPVNERAWTFQEGMLSRRKLRFTAHRIEWECQEDFSVHIENVVGEQFAMEHVYGRHIEESPKFDFFAPSAYKPSRQTIIETWDEAVEDYTSRHLTVADDKLPAFSAIAHEFGRITGDRYLAGHWESMLATDLLWYADRPDPFYRLCHRLHEPAFAPSLVCRAPSWSWAAYDGKVIKHQERSRGAWLDATLLGTQVEPDVIQAPFGRVRPGGYLEFVAVVKKLPRSAPTETGVVHWYTRFPRHEDVVFDETAFFDTEPESEWATCEAWYMGLTVFEREDRMQKDRRPEHDMMGELTGLIQGLNSLLGETSKIAVPERPPKSTAPPDSLEDPMPDELAMNGLIVIPTDSSCTTFRRIGMFRGVPLQWFVADARWQRLKLF